MIRIALTSSWIARALSGCFVVALLHSNDVWAASGIREVHVAADYVAAEDKVAGKVLLDLDDAGNSAGRLRLIALRQVDVSRSGTAASASQEILLDRPLTPRDADGVTFEVAAGDMLVGSLRLKAEMLAENQTAPLSVGWSQTIQVGVRPRIDLSGAWDVTKIEPLVYENKRRPKNWQVPDFGKQISLPGVLTGDEWFRGWVSLKRELAWPARGDLRPRVLRISGVSNSAKASVGGQTIGEVLPLDQVDVLSHWIEYHSPHKGDDKKQLRMQTLDVDVQPPMTMPLPALAQSGTSTIEMTVRATHGQFQPKPMYGVFGDLHVELAPAVFIQSVTFDTEKPGEKRKFKFALAVNNTSGAPWSGKIRSVYGRYAGELPYSGDCPAYASAEQPVTVPAGLSSVEVVREETPRFDTCRATFLLMDKAGKVLDAEQQDFHTVVMEIRDRRDFYLNNERFLLKGQGSWGEDANSRLQLKLMGGNAFRSQKSLTSHFHAGVFSAAENIDDRYKDGLLTSAGPLVASVEKCTFFDPTDTSNIRRAVQGWVRIFSQCPGLIVWEATNELHGEPEEARVAILEAFHKLDPYHRPVLATKGSGEWEAEAREGKVAGVDVVGVQYLLTREAVDSVTVAITEQPIMSTEVNWNDLALHTQGLWHIWLDKGIAGSLLFDYSGNGLRQPVSLVAPPDSEPFSVIRQSNRQLYQDLLPSARSQADGRVQLSLGNQMPYALRQLVVYVKQIGRFELGDLAPGDAATLLLPADAVADAKEPIVVRAEYNSHSGLKHIAILAPTIAPLAKTSSTKH